MSTSSTILSREQAPSTHIFMLVVASAVFMSTLTGSMVNVITPVIRAEFGASAAQIGWVVTGYALAYAVGVPLYGRISDIYGVRRVFVLGLLGFAVGGLICSLAPSLGILVLGRTIQGIGGAAIPALASVAVAKVLPAGNRGGAMGMVASSVGIGSSVGPIVGGTVGQVFGWRVLFIGSLLLVLGLIPFASRVLPDGKSSAERRVDLLGGVLLGLGAGLFLFGITQGQTAGFRAFSSWGCFVGAVLALAGFVWRINTALHPFVSPALFRIKPYVAAMLVAFCVMMVNMSALVFIPLLLVEVNGLSAAYAGLLLTPSAIAVALLSPFAGRLSDRVGVRPLLLTGLTIIGVGIIFLSTFAGGTPLLIAVGSAVLGAGAACIQSPLNNAAANALPASAVGGGMGIFSGAFFLGSATGPALFGAFLAAREGAQAVALNPLNTFAAPHFSDTFLLLVVSLLVAMVATTGLRRARQ